MPQGERRGPRGSGERLGGSTQEIVAKPYPGLPPVSDPRRPEQKTESQGLPTGLLPAPRPRAGVPLPLLALPPVGCTPRIIRADRPMPSGIKEALCAGTEGADELNDVSRGDKRRIVLLPGFAYRYNLTRVGRTLRRRLGRHVLEPEQRSPVLPRRALRAGREPMGSGSSKTLLLARSTTVRFDPGTFCWCGMPL